MLRRQVRRKPAAPSGKAIAVLRDEINAGLKEAMKGGDKRRVSTLRMINAALKDRDIEARGNGREPLNDDEIRALMQKMIKQREESIALYDKAGRKDLATQEREEVAIIIAFLPAQLSDVEAGTLITALVKEIGAESLKDMGRTMAALKERFAGKMDFSKASATVKSLLKG